MNLTKKPAEYTLTLTHEELQEVETILWEWLNPSPLRPSGPIIRPEAATLARHLAHAAISARDGKQ